MTRKFFVFLILFLGLFFVFSKQLHAQVNGNNVGPELPYGTEGNGVIAKTGYTGTAAIILSLGGSVNNYAPSTKTIIRVTDIKHGASIQAVQNFANKLNGASYPTGTLVVFGNELNNLDPVEWNNPGGSVAAAAQEYAKLFIAFSQTINHGKYKVAPAPADLYNGVYSGTAWVDSFASAISGNCGLVDTLVANIFKLNGVANWENKYTYESHICGKSVTHFEGWGADPKATIADQVDFLKTEALPGGVSTGTSLIVNNCSGFGGNIGGTAEPGKAWLYWIPSTPDKVYNADGSEFNYISCSATKKPYVLQDIPCDATTDNSEYHELRPYPASPCKKKVSDTTLLCANDLVVKKTITVQPGGDCTSPDASGSFTCKYTNLPQESTVAINLASAKLPIMGNTDDVANATTNSSSIDMLQRLNNYVSWYLNGTVNMTWEDDWSQITRNELTNRIVNYSGPLNKLLPFRIKTGERIDQAQLASQGTERHNQIALCTLTGTPTPCNEEISLIKQLATLGGLRLNRFTEWLKHIPPKEEAFKSPEEFWKAFIQWEGGVCTPSVVILGHQFYACQLSGINFFAQYISYLLPSTTEDRRGLIGTDKNTTKTDPKTGGSVVELAHTIQSDSQVSEVKFVPTDNSIGIGPDSSKHSLYFSHTQEDAELAKLLQDTFRPSTDPGYSGKNDDGQSFYDTAKYRNCEIQESRTNPGDKLYGEIDKTDENNVKDESIKGTMSFNATFTCKFTLTRDASGNVSYNDCKKDVFASLAIFTKTPNAQENWERLVGGTMSVFKRIFPKVGPNSVLTEIKEIPAVTNVSYTSTSGDTILAGAAGSNRSGDQAQIYFPYIGSLQEYFLQGIQKALRPKDTTTQPEPIAGQRQCDINSSNTTSTTVNGANYVISDGLIKLALQVSKYTCTPAEFIVGVLAGETRGLSYNGTSDSPIKGDVGELICRTSACVTGQTGALGPFSWTQQGYVAQAGNWGNNAQVCLAALGANGALDSRLLGQDMCITSAKFWGSIHDNGNVTSSCTDNRKSYSLDEVSGDGLKLAYMHFCGSDPRCEGYWEKDQQLIEAYKARVATVRGQCTNP